MHQLMIKNGDRGPCALRHLQERSLANYTKKILLLKAEINGMESEKETKLPKFEEVDGLIRNRAREFGKLLDGHAELTVIKEEEANL